MSKHKFKGRMDKLMYMANRMEGLKNTAHFGASRRARHKMAKRIAKGEDIF